MVGIIKFELLKILKRKILVLALILGTAVNLVLINTLKVNYSTAGWSGLFMHFGAWYIIGFIILTGLSAVFSEEYSTGADSLLLCCKNGRKRLVTAKILSSAFFIFAVTFFFMLTDLLFFLLNFGFSGIGSPVQSTRLFTYSPYKLSLFKLLAISSVIKLTGAAAYSLLVLVVSSKSVSNILTLLVSGSVLYFPAIVPIAEDSWFYWIKEFSYEKMLSVNGFFMFDKTYSIFSYHITYLNTALFVFAALSVLFVFTAYYNYTRRQVSDISGEE